MKGFKLIPGPRSYPIIGNLLGYQAPGVGRDPKKSPQIWKHLNQEYGPLVRLDLPGAGKMVLVFDPEYAELVYRNEGALPIRPGFQSLGFVRKQMVETGGLQGLIPSQGTEWKEFRNKVQYSLLHPKVAVTFKTVVHQIALEFADHVESCPENQDFTQEFYKWALEAIAAIALDKRIFCFRNAETDPVTTEILRVIVEILKSSKKLDSGANLWQFLPSKTFRKLETDVKKITQLTSTLILEAIAKEKDSETFQDTLLGNLFKRGCDEQTITIMATDLIFGGVEQTAHAAAFALYLLAVNPLAQEKLLTEIQENQTDQYLRGVVKETMRMYPPAVGNIRKLEVPLKLGDYEIAAETVYILAHQTMSQNGMYVRDPERFIPERWIRNNHKKEEINAFLTLPFGWGPRTCVGRRFTEMEVFSLLSTLVSKFKVGWTGPPLTIKSEIVIFPEGPLRFGFERR